MHYFQIPTHSLTQSMIAYKIAFQWKVAMCGNAVNMPTDYFFYILATMVSHHYKTYKGIGCCYPLLKLATRWSKNLNVNAPLGEQSDIKWDIFMYDEIYWELLRIKHYIITARSIDPDTPSAQAFQH